MLRKWYKGTGAINIAIDFSENAQLEEVRLHLSAASAAEDFATKISSGLGEEFDMVLDTKAMSGLADYQYHPTRPKFIASGDQLNITKTNAAELTWGVEVLWRNV